MFYFRTKHPRSRYIYSCQIYSSNKDKKARAFQHISIASRKSVRDSVRNGADVSSFVALWTSFAGEWIKRTISRFLRRFFTDGSGLLGARKMRRWRELLLEKRAFGRRFGILIVTNNACKGQRKGRAEDYPFYIMPLILLFMNLSSEPSQKKLDVHFVFRWGADFVAINMLDYVTDRTIVDFILLRRLIKHRRWNCTKSIFI